jgi:hypothetical protein
MGYSYFRHPPPLTLTSLLYVVSISVLFRKLSNHNDNSVIDLIPHVHSAWYLSYDYKTSVATAYIYKGIQIAYNVVPELYTILAIWTLVIPHELKAPVNSNILNGDRPSRRGCNGTVVEGGQVTRWVTRVLDTRAQAPSNLLKEPWTMR